MLITVVTSDYVKMEEKEDLFFVVRLVLRQGHGWHLSFYNMKNMKNI